MSYCVICKAECCSISESEMMARFMAAWWEAKYHICQMKLNRVRMDAIGQLRDKDEEIKGLVDNPDYLHEQIDILRQRVGDIVVIEAPC